MKKEFKGTKGGWAVYNNSVTKKGKLGIIMSWDENGQNPIEVASVYTTNAKANAKLIACAPEMLEMLYKIAHGEEFVGVLEIRDLIKKATEL